MILTDQLPTEIQDSQILTFGLPLSDTEAMPPYVWQVDTLAVLVNGSVLSSTAVVSNTVDAEPPPPPTLISPPDGVMTFTTNELTLAWGQSMEAAGYLLDFDGTIQDLSDTTFHNTGFLTDGAYVWTVAAYDLFGNTSAYAPSWTFNVDTSNRLYLPLLIRRDP